MLGQGGSYETYLPPVEPLWTEGVATAYCNCKDVMNGVTGITASGYDLDDGITFRGYRILASDMGIPIGTLVDIQTEGEVIHGIVLDRGSRITDNRFDIVYPSRGDSFNFGIQEIKYKIVGEIEV